MRTGTRILACALAIAAAAAQPAAAQVADPDARWQAFLGCWAPLSAGGSPAPDHVVCFRPDANAVAAVTVVGEEVRGEERIVADGSQRAVQEEACDGTESARWSVDGARVFLRSSLQCGEDVLGRETAGVLALSGSGTFVDVQAVGVDDQYGVRVLQYRSLAPAEYPVSMRDLAHYADDATRLYASAPLSLNDIVEASQLLPAPAAQAMLANLPGSTLRVDADALLALSEAGVSEDVIDMIVALAHPEKFAVATAPLQRDTDDALPARNIWMTDGYYDPYMSYRYGRYSRYGYDSYYSPFGYNRNYGWGYQPGTIIIIDRDDDNDGASSGRGVLVKGRGYTEVGGRGTSTDSSEPRTTSPRPSVDRTRSTGSTAAPSSRGSSGTTRKAQPRNPPTP